MLDPQLRLGILNECLDHLTALRSLFLIEVKTGNNLQFELLGIMIEIARQKNRSGFGELQEQRLVSGCMARREFEHDGAVAEDVMVLAVKQRGLAFFQVAKERRVRSV